MKSQAVITLRAPEPSDIDAMLDWENDSSAWESGSTIAPLSRHQLERYLDNYCGDLAGERQLRLVVVNAAGDAVGAVDIFDYDPLNNRAAVGIIISARERRKGYGSSALIRLADYASRHAGLHQLRAIVSVVNEASLRTFASGGFTESGRLRHWLRRGGDYIDALLLQRILE